MLRTNGNSGRELELTNNRFKSRQPVNWRLKFPWCTFCSVFQTRSQHSIFLDFEIITVRPRATENLVSAAHPNVLHILATEFSLLSVGISFCCMETNIKARDDYYFAIYVSVSARVCVLWMSPKCNIVQRSFCRCYCCCLIYMYLRFFRYAAYVCGDLVFYLILCHTRTRLLLQHSDCVYMLCGVFFCRYFALSISFALL